MYCVLCRPNQPPRHAKLGQELWSDSGSSRVPISVKNATRFAREVSSRREPYFSALATTELGAPLSFQEVMQCDTLLDIRWIIYEWWFYLGSGKFVLFSQVLLYNCKSTQLTDHKTTRSLHLCLGLPPLTLSRWMWRMGSISRDDLVKSFSPHSSSPRPPWHQSTRVDEFKNTPFHSGPARMENGTSSPSLFDIKLE